MFRIDANTSQQAEPSGGDVVVLSTGDIVPADLRLLQAEEIKVLPGPRDHDAIGGRLMHW